MPDSATYSPPLQTQEDREAELLRLLKGEENDSLGYRQSELQQQQIDALKAFYGEKYGDEEDGRSQVVTREVFETIQWTIPDLMRVFASGQNVLYLEETNQGDARHGKDAADYLNWIFYTDNVGYEILHDFAFDGLLHRRGFLACYWREKEYNAPEMVTGLNIMQVQSLMNDPDVEIVAQDFDQESDAGGISLVVRKVKSQGRVEIVNVAPEDMRVNGRAVDLDNARYVGRVLRMLRGEVAAMWPDRADKVREYSGAAVSGPQNVRRGSDVRMIRFNDNSDDWMATGNNAAQEMQVLEEYLRVDLNGDGYPELIRSYRLGDLLLEESEVNENPFGSWAPIRIPHRFYGLSYYDITADLQRRSTVLTRAALDATYQSVVNREAYNVEKVDADALVATYAGAKIPVQGSPGDAILQLSGGVDTSTVAWNALNQLTATLENRTGATRQTQGVDPDALLKGAHSGRAVELLQTAGAARKEVVSRNMGAGLERFFGKLYRLVCRHQSQPRQIKVAGRFATFDPRCWNGNSRVHIHTGLGTGNREQTIMGLQMIGQSMEQWVAQVGPDNPVITSQHRYRWFEEMCRALGYRSAEPFASEPPERPVQGPDGQPQVDPQTGRPATKPWSPEPKPDPAAQVAMQKAQADIQAKQAQMQADAQMEELRYGLEQQKAAAAVQMQQQKDGAAVQVQRQRAELDAALARQKAELDAQLAREKAAAELELAYAKFEGEMTLAREKMTLEAQLRREQIASDGRVGKTQASLSDDDDAALPANRPGGALDE
jgi:hypothetical protein